MMISTCFFRCQIPSAPSIPCYSSKMLKNDRSSKATRVKQKTQAVPVQMSTTGVTSCCKTRCQGRLWLHTAHITPQHILMLRIPDSRYRNVSQRHDGSKSRNIERHPGVSATVLPFCALVVVPKTLGCDVTCQKAPNRASVWKSIAER